MEWPRRSGRFPVLVWYRPAPDRHKGPRDFVFFDFFDDFKISETHGAGLNIVTRRVRSFEIVRTSTAHRLARPSPAPRRPRSRFGYDRHWWGRSAEVGLGEESYWSFTRRPLPSLVFLLPILLAYELGVAWLGTGRAGSFRTGVDAWVRHGLAGFGLTDRWLPPLALVAVLLGWQAFDRRGWRFRPACLSGWRWRAWSWPSALIGLSRLVDLGLHRLEEARPLLDGWFIADGGGRG